jgi:gamma-glutamyltranspeptidase / glutathione hydrolase
VTGRIAAGHPAVVEVAAGILRAGGNAFDAAVAAGFAAAVAEPGLTSLAGGGFLLARAGSGEEVLFDFFVDTPGRGLPVDRPSPHFEAVDVRFPAAVQTFHCGLGSVAVPGALTGYLHVHRRLGRLPLHAVVSPAGRLAEEGVELPPRQAGIIGILEPILTRVPETATVFAPGGVLLRTGDRVRNPDLAGLLAELAAGTAGDFGSGQLHERLVALMGGDGLVTAEDLAAYRVVEREPLAVDYRGRRILTNPPPSFGGHLIGLALELRGARDERWGTPTWATAVVEDMIEVDRRRASELAGEPPRPSTARGTTHISITDDDGNIAAMTTSNGECSGDVIPGTGILLNNMLGEDDLHPGGFHASPPGVRVASMMAPTVVLGDGGRPELVLGSGGSKRIRTAIFQVVSAVVDGGTTVEQAVTAPRLHWDTDHVEVEPGWAPEVLAALEARWPLNVWPEPDVYFGGVHAVVPGADGGAAGDPRRDGADASVS